MPNLTLRNNLLIDGGNLRNKFEAIMRLLKFHVYKSSPEGKVSFPNAKIIFIRAILGGIRRHQDSNLIIFSFTSSCKCQKSFLRLAFFPVVGVLYCEKVISIKGYIMFILPSVKKEADIEPETETCP